MEWSSPGFSLKRASRLTDKAGHPGFQVSIGIPATNGKGRVDSFADSSLAVLGRLSFLMHGGYGRVLVARTLRLWEDSLGSSFAAIRPAHVVASGCR